MSILAVHDRLVPCPSVSSRRRHLALTQQCAACKVDGAIPEYAWRGKPAVQTVRAPRAVAS